jgi:thiol-disulfide isomerase/thioredoxin
MGCGPCQLAIPELINIKDEFSTQSFELISIESWGHRYNLDVLREHKKEKGINYETLYGNSQTAERFHVFGVPTFFVIDKNGIINKRIVGYSKDSTEIELKNTKKLIL